MNKKSNQQAVYLLISNIPAKFRSSNLRFHFSDFIESKGFSCFHFKHRPELTSSKIESKGSSRMSAGKHQLGSDCVDVLSGEKLSQRDPQHCGSGGERGYDSWRGSACCVVSVNEGRVDELLDRYNDKSWMNSDGLSLKTTCHISRIRIIDKSQDECNKHRFSTRAERRKLEADWTTLSLMDLPTLPELRPPSIMPQGNVGTPTKHFLCLIQRCRLPPSIIARLGLVFPRLRSKRRYGAVQYKYAAEGDQVNGEHVTVVTSAEWDSTEAIAVCTNSSDIPAEKSSATLGICTCHGLGEVVNDSHSSEDIRTCAKCNCFGSFCGNSNSTRINSDSSCNKSKKYSCLGHAENASDMGREKNGESDSDDCEDWERYEALHDDPSNRERNKERMFEEDMEVVWEKGGSGLVWYTDAQYWDQADGDEEEKDVDDWDIDCSAYYDPEFGGDKDARDFVTMLRDTRRREGLESEAKQQEKSKCKHYKSSQSIASSDLYNKGIGRRVLMKHGWSEGQPLGRSVKGLTEALEGEGQAPWDKKGLGYRGEKIIHLTTDQASKGRSSKHQSQDLLRAQEPTHSKLVSMARGTIRDEPSPRAAVVTRPSISTVYDDPVVTDPPEGLLRRREPHHLKHRAAALSFVRSSEPWRS